MVHCHSHGLGEEYVHTNPLMIGTQIAKITVLQINDDRGFSISHKQMSIPGLCECERGNVRLRTGRGCCGCRNVVGVRCKFRAI
jgi:hypothetical protein